MFSEASPVSSLRQRNVGTVSSSSDTVSSRWERGEPYVMLGGSNSSLIRSTPNLSEGESSGFMFLDGYCRVGGVAARTAPTSGSGYVSLPPPTTSAVSRSAAAPATSSGYVTHPPWWGENKEPRSPAPVAPAPAASKGYVMAGENGTPSSYCRLGWEKPSTHTHSDYVPHRQLDSDL